MEKILRDKKAILVFVLPALIIYTVIMVVPVINTGVYSFYEWDGLGDKVFIGVENYVDLFVNNNDGFLKSVLNTFLLGILSVAIQIPIGLFFALVLARGIKGEDFFRNVFFIPVIISTVIIAQLWMKIYHPSLGLINNFLASIGLENLQRAWLGEQKTALIAVLVPIVWQYIGRHMLLLYASLKSIPESICEAAMIDGANERQVAFKIKMPLIKPMLKVCVTFAVIGSIKAFDLIYILTNGGPNHASEVISTLMYGTIFDKFMYGYGSAMAVFIVLECLIFSLAINKLFGIGNKELL